MSTKQNQNLPLTEAFYLHMPEGEVSLTEILNGLSLEETLLVGLQKGVYRHDAFGLSSRRREIWVSNRTAYLVRRFAQRHGISLVAAADLLFWSGLNYQHGRELPVLPLEARAPTLPEKVKPDGKTKGRPKTGRGKECSIRLTPSLESQLFDYGDKYGNLIRKWMKQYAENPVLFKDSTHFQLDSGRNNRPQLGVSFLPWQVELLKEIELAFGCTRSQALLKILVAIGVAGG